MWGRLPLSCEKRCDRLVVAVVANHVGIIPFIKNNLHKDAVHFTEDQSLELCSKLNEFAKVKAKAPGKRPRKLCKLFQ